MVFSLRYILFHLYLQSIHFHSLGFRLQSSKCTTVVDSWKKLQHSNVVQLREVFTTKSFNDQCKRSSFVALARFYWLKFSTFSPCASLRLSSRLSDSYVKILLTVRRFERLLGSIPGRCETIQVSQTHDKGTARRPFCNTYSLTVTKAICKEHRVDPCCTRPKFGL